MVHNERPINFQNISNKFKKIKENEKPNGIGDHFRIGVEIGKNIFHFFYFHACFFQNFSTLLDCEHCK
jgi:hypothetical protein